MNGPRRRFAKLGSALLLASLVTPLADAQTKVKRIGMLGSGSAAASASLVDAFRTGMRERGWTEGRDYVLDIRFAENRMERLPDLAADLLRARADLIVATPAVAAEAVRKATGTVPIVMAMVTDPVALGLVASVARPGANVTGVASSFADLQAKRLQLLKEAIPSAKRIAVLSNPSSATQAAAVAAVTAAAPSLGLSLQFLEARTPADFEPAFAAIAKERGEAVLVLADPLFGTHAQRIGELVAKHRLPSMFGTRGEFEPGGLMFYGPNGPEQLRQAAGYADKILKGAKSGDLAVEQPTKIDFVVNLRAANALRLTMPPSLLAWAEVVP
jgi:putative ABC transport system substrate-binding protein